MEDAMYLGLMLMAVGMTTVFTILALVVLGGKLMIIITNRYAPVPELTMVKSMPTSGIAAAKIAAITAAVESVTHGRGKIDKIEKL